MTLVWTQTTTPPIVDPAPIVVTLVAEPPPAPVVAPQPPAAPTPVAKPVAKPVARRAAAKTTRSSIARRSIAPEATPGDPAPGLSEAQLAGAASADSGAGGGPCDMARRVQSALRRDAMIQAAVAGSAGKAILVWNGDWVRSGGEDGKGLAAVREAIMWEIGFAPPSCRAEPVHGLILLSLGGTRLALGTRDWRWSDLLSSGGDRSASFEP
jgi:hypothetical protein